MKHLQVSAALFCWPGQTPRTVEISKCFILEGAEPARALKKAFFHYFLRNDSLYGISTPPRAFSTASAAFVALLGPVLALEACPSFVTTHRAVLLATLPPFCALLVTLAPIFVRIRAPPPPSTAYGRGAPLAAAEGAGRDGVGEEVEAESSGYDTHDDSDRDW